MNNELDKKKEEFLENIGEYHRNVVMLLNGTILKKNALDSTKACTIDAMRVPLMRLCDSVHQAAFMHGMDRGKHHGLIEGESVGHEKGYIKGKAEGQKVGYDIGLAEGLRQGEANGYDRGLDDGRCERVEAYEIASRDAEKRGFESGKALGITEGSSAGYAEGYKHGFDDGKRSGYDYGEAFSKGYDAGKKTALREQKGLKGAVEIGHELDAEARVRVLNDIGKVVTMQPGQSYVDSFIRQYGFQTFSDLTGQTNAFEELHNVHSEYALLGRTKWNAWPLMLRHDYVQARLVDGVPSVQLVVNGEWSGAVTPNGGLVAPPSDGWRRLKGLAMRVAKYDALIDRAVNVRVPDSKVGLFLFIDSKGNEFELKNTEYGTVIVKGDIVLGVVSSKTAIEHTHGALQQCDEHGKLTHAVFAFCKWARDSGALPRFMMRSVAIEGQLGFSVRADDRGRFEVLDITGKVVVILNPHINGTFGVLSIDAPLDTRAREIVEAAKRTVRSKFYGNMVL